MKFVIATGGTGGHLFPALRVAQELAKQGHDILFLGSFRLGQEQMAKSGFAFKDMGARGLVLRNPVKAVGAVVAMIGAIVKSFQSLRVFKPDAVLGFGGYGAFPVVFSAVCLKVPALIHEQNVVPGRANAILAKWVGKIAISFHKSAAYFNPKKIVLTGCPCHLPKTNINRTEIFKHFELEEGKKTILVFGGSQGSQRINEVFIEAAAALKDKLDVQVIHISGHRDEKNLLIQYNQMGIPFALFPFLDKMEEVYTIADLVICRSGAVTVSEIAAFKLPAIFVPYPHAQGHQKDNASVLCEAHVAHMIEQKDLSASTLTEAIVHMLGHSSEIRDETEKFSNVFIVDATKKLAQEALQLACQD